MKLRTFLILQALFLLWIILKTYAEDKQRYKGSKVNENEIDSQNISSTRILKEIPYFKNISLTKYTGKESNKTQQKSLKGKDSLKHIVKKQDLDTVYEAKRVKLSKKNKENKLKKKHDEDYSYKSKILSRMKREALQPVSLQGFESYPSQNFLEENFKELYGNEIQTDYDNLEEIKILKRDNLSRYKWPNGKSHFYYRPYRRNKRNKREASQNSESDGNENGSKSNSGNMQNVNLNLKSNDDSLARNEFLHNEKELELPIKNYEENESEEMYPNNRNKYLRINMANKKKSNRPRSRKSRYKFIRQRATETDYKNDKHMQPFSYQHFGSHNDKTHSEIDLDRINNNTNTILERESVGFKRYPRDDSSNTLKRRRFYRPERGYHSHHRHNDEETDRRLTNYKWLDRKRRFRNRNRGRWRNRKQKRIPVEIISSRERDLNKNKSFRQISSSSLDETENNLKMENSTSVPKPVNIPENYFPSKNPYFQNYDDTKFNIAVATKKISENEKIKRNTEEEYSNYKSKKLINGKGTPNPKQPNIFYDPKMKERDKINRKKIAVDHIMKMLNKNIPSLKNFWIRIKSLKGKNYMSTSVPSVSESQSSKIPDEKSKNEILKNNTSIINNLFKEDDGKENFNKFGESLNGHTEKYMADKDETTTELYQTISLNADIDNKTQNIDNAESTSNDTELKKIEKTKLESFHYQNDLTTEYSNTSNELGFQTENLLKSRKNNTKKQYMEETNQIVKKENPSIRKKNTIENRDENLEERRSEDSENIFFNKQIINDEIKPNEKYTENVKSELEINSQATTVIHFLSENGENKIIRSNDLYNDTSSKNSITESDDFNPDTNAVFQLLGGNNFNNRTEIKAITSDEAVLDGASNEKIFITIKGKSNSSTLRVHTTTAASHFQEVKNTSNVSNEFYPGTNKVDNSYDEYLIPSVTADSSKLFMSTSPRTESADFNTGTNALLQLLSSNNIDNSTKIKVITPDEMILDGASSGKSTLEMEERLNESTTIVQTTSAASDIQEVTGANIFTEFHQQTNTVGNSFDEYNTQSVTTNSSKLFMPTSPRTESVDFKTDTNAWFELLGNNNINNNTKIKGITSDEVALGNSSSGKESIAVDGISNGLTIRVQTTTAASDFQEIIGTYHDASNISKEFYPVTNKVDNSYEEYIKQPVTLGSYKLPMHTSPREENEVYGAIEREKEKNIFETSNKNVSEKNIFTYSNTSNDVILYRKSDLDSEFKNVNTNNNSVEKNLIYTEDKQKEKIILRNIAMNHLNFDKSSLPHKNLSLNIHSIIIILNDTVPLKLNLGKYDLKNVNVRDRKETNIISSKQYRNGDDVIYNKNKQGNIDIFKAKKLSENDNYTKNDMIYSPSFGHVTESIRIEQENYLNPQLKPLGNKTYNEVIIIHSSNDTKVPSNISSISSKRHSELKEKPTEKQNLIQVDIFTKSFTPNYHSLESSQIYETHLEKLKGKNELNLRFQSNEGDRASNLTDELKHSHLKGSTINNINENFPRTQSTETSVFILTANETETISEKYIKSSQYIKTHPEKLKDVNESNQRSPSREVSYKSNDEDTDFLSIFGESGKSDIKLSLNKEKGDILKRKSTSTEIKHLGLYNAATESSFENLDIMSNGIRETNLEKRERFDESITHSHLSEASHDFSKGFDESGQSNTIDFSMNKQSKDILVKHTNEIQNLDLYNITSESFIDKVDMKNNGISGITFKALEELESSREISKGSKGNDKEFSSPTNESGQSEMIEFVKGKEDIVKKQTTETQNVPLYSIKSEGFTEDVTININEKRENNLVTTKDINELTPHPHSNEVNQGSNFKRIDLSKFLDEPKQFNAIKSSTSKELNYISKTLTTENLALYNITAESFTEKVIKNNDNIETTLETLKGVNEFVSHTRSSGVNQGSNDKNVNFSSTTDESEQPEKMQFSVNKEDIPVEETTENQNMPFHNVTTGGFTENVVIKNYENRETNLETLKDLDNITSHSHLSGIGQGSSDRDTGLSMASDESGQSTTIKFGLSKEHEDILTTEIQNFILYNITTKNFTEKIPVKKNLRSSEIHLKTLKNLQGLISQSFSNDVSQGPNDKGIYVSSVTEESDYTDATQFVINKEKENIRENQTIKVQNGALYNVTLESFSENVLIKNNGSREAYLEKLKDSDELTSHPSLNSTSQQSNNRVEEYSIIFDKLTTEKEILPLNEEIINKDNSEKDQELIIYTHEDINNETESRLPSSFYNESVNFIRSNYSKISNEEIIKTLKTPQYETIIDKMNNTFREIKSAFETNKPENNSQDAHLLAIKGLETDVLSMNDMNRKRYKEDSSQKQSLVMNTEKIQIHNTNQYSVTELNDNENGDVINVTKINSSNMDNLKDTKLSNLKPKYKFSNAEKNHTFQNDIINKLLTDVIKSSDDLLHPEPSFMSGLNTTNISIGNSESQNYKNMIYKSYNNSIDESLTNNDTLIELYVTKTNETSQGKESLKNGNITYLESRPKEHKTKSKFSSFSTPFAYLYQKELLFPQITFQKRFYGINNKCKNTELNRAMDPRFLNLLQYLNFKLPNRYFPASRNMVYLNPIMNENWKNNKVLLKVCSVIFTPFCTYMVKTFDDPNMYGSIPLLDYRQIAKISMSPRSKQFYYLKNANIYSSRWQDSNKDQNKLSYPQAAWLSTLNQNHEPKSIISFLPFKNFKTYKIIAPYRKRSDMEFWQNEGSDAIDDTSRGITLNSRIQNFLYLYSPTIKHGVSNQTYDKITPYLRRKRNKLHRNKGKYKNHKQNEVIDKGDKLSKYNQGFVTFPEILQDSFDYSKFHNEGTKNDEIYVSRQSAMTEPVFRPFSHFLPTSRLNSELNKKDTSNPFQGAPKANLVTLHKNLNLEDNPKAGDFQENNKKANELSSEVIPIRRVKRDLFSTFNENVFKDLAIGANTPNSDLIPKINNNEEIDIPDKKTQCTKCATELKNFKNILNELMEQGKAIFNKNIPSEFIKGKLIDVNSKEYIADILKGKNFISSKNINDFTKGSSSLSDSHLKLSESIPRTTG